MTWIKIETGHWLNMANLFGACVEPTHHAFRVILMLKLDGSDCTSWKSGFETKEGAQQWLDTTMKSIGGRNLV